jgi:hypothetical protein
VSTRLGLGSARALRARTHQEEQRHAQRSPRISSSAWLSARGSLVSCSGSGRPRREGRVTPFGDPSVERLAGAGRWPQLRDWLVAIRHDKRLAASYEAEVFAQVLSKLCDPYRGHVHQRSG